MSVKIQSPEVVRGTDAKLAGNLPREQMRSLVLIILVGKDEARTGEPAV
jgi:hypothetical protein